MSVMVIDSASMSRLADCVAEMLNRIPARPTHLLKDSGFSRVSAYDKDGNDLDKRAFPDCRDESGKVDPAKVFNALMRTNLKAYAERYPSEKVDIEDDMANAYAYEPRLYGSDVPIALQDNAKLRYYNLVRGYLYQCDELTDDPVVAWMVAIRAGLAASIAYDAVQAADLPWCAW